MKHARWAYNALTGESLLAGGDHCSSGPGACPPNGGGAGSNTILATTNLSTWRMLAPACPPSGVYPGEADTVPWAIDTKRNKAYMWPGFYFISEGLNPCPGGANDPNAIWSALIFDLGANTWSATTPWSPPNNPPTFAGGYWGDTGMAFSVYDPVSDAVYGFAWDGDWGNVLWKLDLTTNTWTKTQIGQSPYDDSLRNNYLSHSQVVLDVTGRKLYVMSMAGMNDLMYVDLAVPGHTGAWAPNKSAPASCVQLDDNAQEKYAVFDTDHRAVISPCVPNTGGEVVGVAVYFVDTATWAYSPAPVNNNDPNPPVLANAFVYSPAAHAVLATGGHRIFTENPARPNYCPNPCNGDATTVPPGVPPGNQTLPDSTVDWQIRLTP